MKKNKRPKKRRITHKVSSNIATPMRHQFQDEISSTQFKPNNNLSLIQLKLHPSISKISLITMEICCNRKNL